MRIGQKLSFPLLLLVISNIITGITNKATLFEYISFIGFFIVIIGCLFFIKKEIVTKPFIAWLILALSLIAQFLLDVTDLTGISLFVLSLSISKKSKQSYMIYSSLFFAILLYKFNTSGMHPSQLMAYSSGIMLFLTIYQHYIHPIKDNEYRADYNNKVIEKLYIDIMILYLNGYSWNKISLELKRGVTGKTLARTLDNEWKRRKFKNREQFAHYLGQMHIINNIDKNVITG
jgi:hypothetical protein